MWPEVGASGAEPLAVATRWERMRRPNQLAQRGVGGEWRPADAPALAAGPVLLLLHDTFSTAQATFPEWLDHADFAPLAATFGDRCLAFTHPTLATGIEENLAWLVERLAQLPGPVDIVAHGRGGLLARALAADGRLPLRRVCQVGTPNQGTALAVEAHLMRFLDAHLAMLAHLPVAVSQATLEGVLCMARILALGQRPTLPGVQALTPERATHHALLDRQVTGQRWFTIGARFMAPEGSLDIRDEFDAVPNDLVVPTQGCHEPGIPVTDSLRLAGVDTHHHNYFANPRVRERLAEWFG
jgi:pimeloyl-ACP methyl ester carboxylesterase